MFWIVLICLRSEQIFINIYNQIGSQIIMTDSSEGRCGVVVSRNVVVTQIRSDPGSIPGISIHFLVLLETNGLIGSERPM